MICGLDLASAPTHDDEAVMNGAPGLGGTVPCGVSMVMWQGWRVA